MHTWLPSAKNGRKLEFPDSLQGSQICRTVSARSKIWQTSLHPLNLGTQGTFKWSSKNIKWYPYLQICFFMTNKNNYNRCWAIWSIWKFERNARKKIKTLRGSQSITVISMFLACLNTILAIFQSPRYGQILWLKKKINQKEKTFSIPFHFVHVSKKYI